MPESPLVPFTAGVSHEEWWPLAALLPPGLVPGWLRETARYSASLSHPRIVTDRAHSALATLVKRGLVVVDGDTLAPSPALLAALSPACTATTAIHLRATGRRSAVNLVALVTPPRALVLRSDHAGIVISHHPVDRLFEQLTVLLDEPTTPPGERTSVRKPDLAGVPSPGIVTESPGQATTAPPDLPSGAAPIEASLVDALVWGTASQGAAEWLETGRPPRIDAPALALFRDLAAHSQRVVQLRVLQAPAVATPALPQPPGTRPSRAPLPRVSHHGDWITTTAGQWVALTLAPQPSGHQHAGAAARPRAANASDQPRVSPSDRLSPDALLVRLAPTDRQLVEDELLHVVLRQTARHVA